MMSKGLSVMRPVPSVIQRIVPRSISTKPPSFHPISPEKKSGFWVFPKGEGRHHYQDLIQEKNEIVRERYMKDYNFDPTKKPDDHIDYHVVFAIENVSRPTGFESVGGYAISNLKARPGSVDKLLSFPTLSKLSQREKIAFWYYKQYFSDSFFEMNALARRHCPHLDSHWDKLMFGSLLKTMDTYQFTSVICTTVPTASDRLHRFNEGQSMSISFDTSLEKMLRHPSRDRIRHYLSQSKQVDALCRDIADILFREPMPESYPIPSRVSELLKQRKQEGIDRDPGLFQSQLASYYRYHPEEIEQFLVGYLTQRNWIQTHRAIPNKKAFLECVALVVDVTLNLHECADDQRINQVCTLNADDTGSRNVINLLYLPSIERYKVFTCDQPSLMNESEKDQFDIFDLGQVSFENNPYLGEFYNVVGLSLFDAKKSIIKNSALGSSRLKLLTRAYQSPSERQGERPSQIEFDYEQYLPEIKYFKSIIKETHDTASLLVRYLRQLPFKPHGSYTIADIGCGLGHMYPEIKSRVSMEHGSLGDIHYQGLDNNLDLLQEANTLYPSPTDMFVQFDIIKDRFHDELYDVMLLKRILQHVPPHQLRDVLVQLRDGLKMNGYMVIIETDWESLHLGVNTKTALAWEQAIKNGEVGENPNFNAHFFSLVQSVPGLMIREVSHIPMNFNGPHEVSTVLDPGFELRSLGSLRDNALLESEAWTKATCNFDVRCWVLQKVSRENGQ